MQRTIIGLMLASATLVACGIDGKLAIKSIPSPLTSGQLPPSERVAEGNAQFALGNVGLALESYRRALRDQSDDAQAMVGMARCYDQMGRFDLSRIRYEQALAVAPSSPFLLEALARSFDQQGLVVEAARVRREAASPIARPAQLAMADAVTGPSVTIDLPLAPATSPAIAQIATPTIEPPAGVAPAQLSLDSTPSRRSADVRLERMSEREVVLLTHGQPSFAQPRPVAPQAIAAVRPAPAPAAATRLSLLLATPLRTPSPSASLMRPVLSQATPAPRVRTHASVTIDLPRHSRMAVLTVDRGPVLVLNASRVRGMAALTRLRIMPLSGARIGDAPQVMARSLILYGVGDRARALRIAAVTGLQARQLRWKRAGVTVLLGRDWTARRARG